MRTLIAVVTARHREPWREAIRNTWLPLVPPYKADVRFFMGTGEPIGLKLDEIQIDCDDSYRGLPEKVRGIARWAESNNYDFMLKCDDDTVLNPRMLLDSGYENHLFSGKLNRYPTDQHPYPITVGYNYWLAKKCINLIANAELPPELGPGVKDNDDEKWVAGTLYNNGIQLHNDHRYCIHAGDLTYDPAVFNYPRRPLRPQFVAAPHSQDIFSWSIFLEANSGEGIPLDKKIAEFYKVFQKMTHGKT